MRVIAIDFGTTASCTAVRSGSEPASLWTFGDVGTRYPSAVYADDGGVLVTGATAQNQAGRDPSRFEPTPKRLVTDGLDLAPIGDAPGVPTIDLVAAVVAAIVHHARADGPVDRVVATHPAAWGPRPLSVLIDALGACGLDDPMLMMEPVAAAWAVVRPEDRVDGAPYAIFDWGGGTFDAAVVRWDGAGFAVAGPTVGLNNVGGDDVDDALWTFALGQVPPDVRDPLLATDGDTRSRRAALRLRADIRQAKHDLTSAPSVDLFVRDEFLTLTRDELVELAGGLVDQCVQSMMDCIAGCGIGPDELRGVYLTGDASRMPIVHQRLWAALGNDVVPKLAGDAKGAVALGAAWAIDAPTKPPPRPPQPPPSPPSPPAPSRDEGRRKQSGSTGDSHGKDVRARKVELVPAAPMLAVNALAVARQLSASLPGSHTVYWVPERCVWVSRRDVGDAVTVSVVHTTVRDEIATDPQKFANEISSDRVTSVARTQAFGAPGLIIDLVDDQGIKTRQLVATGDSWAVLYSAVGNDVIEAMTPHLTSLADASIVRPKGWMGIPAPPVSPKSSRWLLQPPGYPEYLETLSFVLSFNVDGTDPLMSVTLYHDPDRDSVSQADRDRGALMGLHASTPGLRPVFEGPCQLPGAGAVSVGHLLSGGGQTAFATESTVGGRNLGVTFAMGGETTAKKFGRAPDAFGRFVSYLPLIEHRTH